MHAAADDYMAAIEDYKNGSIRCLARQNCRAVADYANVLIAIYFQGWSASIRRRRIWYKCVVERYYDQKRFAFHLPLQQV